MSYTVGNVAAVNGGGGGPFVTGLSVGGQGNGGAFTNLPVHVRLKPCIFDPSS